MKQEPSGRFIYASTDEQRATARDRHAALRAVGRCINGPFEDRPGRRGGIVHGPVVSAGRCQHCLDVKRRTH